MIKKAVITAAGKGTRQYPATNSVQKELFPLVDRDGISKPTIQIIIEEAMRAGIEELAIVIQPDEATMFQTHFCGLSADEKLAFANKPWGLSQSDLLERMRHCITYIPQYTQEGYGHAVHCAGEWVGDEPFLLLLGDHVFLSNTSTSCLQQILNGFDKYRQSIFGVQPTPANDILRFGTVTGEKLSDSPLAFRVTRVAEKPTISFARQHLTIPGLTPDHYLAFFGSYVFTPTIFTILQEHIRDNVRENGEIQLATAQAELIRREGAIALEISGRRLDMGTPLGYLETQLALARGGVFSREIEQIWQRLHEC